MAGVQGSYNPIFKFVRDLLKHNLAEGKEVGASISANTDGQNVVDIWGDHADTNRTRPWEKNNITGIRSSMKVVTYLT